jgi:hypothetical protein
MTDAFDNDDNNDNDNVTRIALSFTHNNNNYKLIEIGSYGSYITDKKWLCFPDVYIVCNDTDFIELGSCWKCGIEEGSASFNPITECIQFEGYFMGQEFCYEIYKLNGDFINRICVDL